jgi:hypothetical protein
LTTPVDFTPFVLWVASGLPYLSVLKKLDLSKKRRLDYSHYLLWREFPLLKISAAKVTVFSLIGAASLAYAIPMEKTLLGVFVLGVFGLAAEATVTRERAYPTQGYVRQVVCQYCRAGDHENCANLRMLDGFETSFKSGDGTFRPVCCCGFRISQREEIQT